MAIECEKKYRVYGLKETDMPKALSKRNLEQFYLDKENPKLKDFVCYIFDLKKEKLENISEARVRVVNGERFLLTIKSGGDMKREEYETEITFLGEDLIRDYAISKISKTRYDCPSVSSYNTIEIDFYNDRDMVVAEMEFDPYELDELEVDKQVRDTLKMLGAVMVTDVTTDKSYKNANLAIPFAQQESE